MRARAGARRTSICEWKTSPPGVCESYEWSKWNLDSAMRPTLSPFFFGSFFFFSAPSFASFLTASGSPARGFLMIVVASCASTSSSSPVSK